MRTKIIQKSTRTTPLAGIFFIEEYFDKYGIGELCNKVLGSRAKQAHYSYSDIIKSLWTIPFTGGQALEDINNQTGNVLKQRPGAHIPNADTLGYSMKKLATNNFEVKTTVQTYNCNRNAKLCALIIRMMLMLNILKAYKSYDFDFDNQLIPTEKYDAKYSYKKCFGYFPGVSFINGLPFNIENRDGNMNVKTNQAEFLEMSYNQIEEYNIGINRSRMDAGSYSEEIIDVVARHSEKFYIRAVKYNNLMAQLQTVSTWREVELNYERCEVASIGFTSFFEDRNYRLVVQRTETDDPQGDLFFGKKYVVRTILTNDWNSSEEEIIAYYNQRGNIERQFDIQNNDFNWAHLPFSDMKNNTVFLFLMAMARVFFEFVKSQVNKVFGNIVPLKCRMKRFIFRFVNVAGKWIRQARQNILVLYSDAPYKQLLC